MNNTQEEGEEEKGEENEEEGFSQDEYEEYDAYDFLQDNIDTSAYVQNFGTHFEQETTEKRTLETIVVDFTDNRKKRQK